VLGIGLLSDRVVRLPIKASGTCQLDRL
jgi:hypothetical protein